MSTVKLTGSNIFDSQIQMHTDNQKYDVSLAREFHHHLKKYHRKNDLFDQSKKIKNSWKENI